MRISESHSRASGDRGASTPALGSGILEEAIRRREAGRRWDSARAEVGYALLCVALLSGAMIAAGAALSLAHCAARSACGF